jgi:hypothetical protein
LDVALEDAEAVVRGLAQHGILILSEKPIPVAIGSSRADQ